MISSMQTANSDRRRCRFWSAAVLFLCICVLLAGAGILGACGMRDGNAAGEGQRAGVAGGLQQGNRTGEAQSGSTDGESQAGSAAFSGNSDGGNYGDATDAAHSDAFGGSMDAEHSDACGDSMDAAGGTGENQNPEGTKQDGGTSGEQRVWITETETISRPPFEVTRKADSFAGIVPDRFGTAGLLLIPDVGINVRLFDGSTSSDPHNQKGVDMEDYAVLINYGGSDVIGDHSNQGFSALCRSVQDETRAYIVQEDHSYHEYVCVGVLDGSNEEYHLYGSDGLDYMHAVSDRYDLVMYTCLENWEHIEIGLWKDVDAAVQLSGGH